MMWVAVIACAAVASLLFFAMVCPKISILKEKIARISIFEELSPYLLKLAKISIFSKCWQILPKCAFVFVGGGLYPH